MLYLNLLKVLFVIILIINVIVNGENEARLSVKRKFLGKNKMDGVYDKKKFEDDPTTFKINDEEKESKDEIKRKLSYVEVDNEGNEYLNEIDEDEVLRVIERGNKVLLEGSNTNDNDNNNNDKSKDEDEKDRRLQTILGTDTRAEIKVANFHPVNKIGLLEFSGGSCTATLIGPKTVLTAGHCVHSGQGGNWYNSFRFYPARTSTYTPTPYYYSFGRVFSFQGWTLSSDYNYDIALVELILSPNIGYVSFGVDNNINTNWFVYFRGYPADKPYGSMWATGDYISATSEHILQTDDSDSEHGMSGSAVFAYPSYLTYPRIFAAHSGAGWWFGWYHRHTRITSGKYSAFCTWMNTPSVC